MRRRQRLNYEKSQKFAANCVHVAIFIQVTILTYFLYQVTLGGQTDWENLYGCYLCVLISGGLLIAYVAKRNLEDMDGDRLRSMLQGIRIWFPLICGSIFGFLLTWPLFFSPNPIDPWKICLLFSIPFSFGVFCQLITFGATVPPPSATETRMCIYRWPWLQRFFLEKSLHAGLSLQDRPAPKTRLIAAELTHLPTSKLWTFKTQFDGQQQVMLDFFWDIYGQRFHCERFAISNIPVGIAGETFEILIYVNQERAIECEVAEPLIVTRICVQPK